MKSLPLFTAMLFTLSLVGCCCGRSYVMDACDPCGGYVDTGCGCGRGFCFPWTWGGGRCRSCSSCSSCGGCGGGVVSGGCSGGNCGGSMGMPGQPGCNCNQGSTDSMYPGSSVPFIDGSGGGTPVPSLPSAPVPNNKPTYSPSTSSPAVIPGNESTMMMQPSNGMQPQMVSYEEFQRLPGTIISGPGAVTPPVMNSNANSNLNQIQQASGVQPFLAPPQPSSPTMSARQIQAGQPSRTSWLPAPSN